MVTTDLTGGYWIKCSRKGGNFPNKDRSVWDARGRMSRLQKTMITVFWLTRLYQEFDHHMIK